MKQLIYLSALLALTISITSCKKESTPTAILDEKINTEASQPVSAKSGFSNGSYGVVTGDAIIYQVNGKYQLALKDFTSSNGPDLKVYISKEQQPINFVNLGSLKSTMGNQVYDIPDNVDVKDYTYALIYCKQYSHLFGYTKLTY